MLYMVCVNLQQLHTPAQNVVLMIHNYSVVYNWHHLLTMVMSTLALCCAIVQLRHLGRTQQFGVATTLHNA